MFRLVSRPELVGLVDVPGGDVPIEQAFTGLCLAVNAVVKADHGVHLRDWEQRRNRLLDPWLKSKLPSLWTNSYFVATVGGAPLSVIKCYVETQKER